MRRRKGEGRKQLFETAPAPGGFSSTKSHRSAFKLCHRKAKRHMIPLVPRLKIRPNSPELDLKENSTLSSVYVTTESHEKRMSVAGQCALRFAGKIHVVSYFCFKILGNFKHRRFISTFYTW